MASTTVYLEAMESQQLVEYVVDQMRVGYSEATLREHLQSHGWQAEAIDAAFVKYHRLNAAELRAARAARRKARRHKWTQLQRVRASGIVVIALALLAVGFHMFVTKSVAPTHSALKPLTYAQKQASDVNVVAGAVAQYAAETESLPTVIGTNPDGSMVFCGKNCGAINPVTITLGIYKPADIEFASYNAGLTPPNQDTMYLVPGAKCASGTTLGDANPNPRSMVILYAQEKASGLAQHCVVL